MKRNASPDLGEYTPDRMLAGEYVLCVTPSCGFCRGEEAEEACRCCSSGRQVVFDWENCHARSRSCDAMMQRFTIQLRNEKISWGSSRVRLDDSVLQRYVETSTSVKSRLHSGPAPDTVLTTSITRISLTTVTSNTRCHNHLTIFIITKGKALHERFCLLAWRGVCWHAHTHGAAHRQIRKSYLCFACTPGSGRLGSWCRAIRTCRHRLAAGRATAATPDDGRRLTWRERPIPSLIAAQRLR